MSTDTRTESRSTARIVSFVVLLAIIGLIGFLFYRVMAGFLLPLFLAVLLVVIFRPLHDRLQRRFPGRPRIAAGLTTATVAGIVLLPLTLLFILAITEGSTLVGNFSPTLVMKQVGIARDRIPWLAMPHRGQLREVDALIALQLEHAANGRAAEADDLQRLSELFDHLRNDSWPAAGGTSWPATSDVARQFSELQETLGELTGSPPLPADGEAYREASSRLAVNWRDLKQDLLGGSFLAQIKEAAHPDDAQLESLLRQLTTHAANWLFAVGGRSTAFVLQTIIGLVIMMIAMYFFLLDGPVMVQSFMRLSPLDDRYERELLQEFVGVSRAVVVATLVSALAQGLLAGIGFWTVGFERVFLLTLLTTFFALIPFVGAAAVWVPACAWLLMVEERMWPAILLAIWGGGVVSMVDNFIKPAILHGQARLHPLLALLSVLGGVQALGPIGILVGPMVVVFLQTLLNILHRETMAMDRRTSSTPPAAS